MSISVLIPAYNCSKTIQATLDSVLAQTRRPDQVIVMDDGSTDDTLALVESYRPRVTVLRQPNKGVAAARNALCGQAQGDLIAFLDADDVWHPRYLEVQNGLFEKHPNAAAFFTGHTSFCGYGSFTWDAASDRTSMDAELINPLDFLRRYNATGDFACMSFCCVPKKALTEMGSEYFCISAAEDAYFCNTLPLLDRPVVYFPHALVAYRVSGTSLSANQFRVYSSLIQVFQLLEGRYNQLGNTDLLAAFRLAFASKRRTYAKILMGTGDSVEARRQFWLSLRDSHATVSWAKSLALLLITWFPERLQPNWPITTRPLINARD